MKINMIGFNWPKGARRYKFQDDDWVMLEPEYKYCVIHPSNRLVKYVDGDPDKLYCPECGYHEQKSGE
jgi:hypothetical protein